MAILRPDRYRHNNSNLPIVWLEDVKGGTFIVENQSAMLNIPKDKLTLYNRVRYPDGNNVAEWELRDVSDPTDISNWKKVASGALLIVDTFGNLPATGDDVGQLVKVNDASGDSGRPGYIVYIWSSPTEDTWNRFIREDSLVYKTNFSDDLEIPSNYTNNIAGKTAADIKNKTFSEFVDLHFSDVDPELSNRSASLTGVSGTYEVGTPISPSMSSSFNRGSITNGANYNHPQDGTGQFLVGLPSSYNFKNPGGSSDQIYNTSNLTQAHNFSEHIITEGTNTWSVTIEYLAGTGNYYNNKGVLSNIFDANRVASSITASDSLTGRYASFFGTSTEEGLVSSQIIALSDKNLVTSKVRTFNSVSATGGEYVYYYYDADYGALNNIIMDGAAPVLTAFTRVSDIVVTNIHGISKTYIGYVSNATNAFTNNSLAFS